MAALMIGVDPDKGSRTAVAIGAAEKPLGEVGVRACVAQADRLLAWATAWPQRAWAVEGAAGLGHLLAQQLVADGEQVADVQPKLGARVRLLASGDMNKNDPNDARSVAIAALRSPAHRQVAPMTRGGIQGMVQAPRDLGRSRPRLCVGCMRCCASWAGGVAKEITAGHAARLLESITPPGAVEAARCELAAAFPDDLRRIDAQLLEANKKLNVAVRASGTTLTSIFGAGARRLAGRSAYAAASPAHHPVTPSAPACGSSERTLARFPAASANSPRASRSSPTIQAAYSPARSAVSRAR